VIPTSWIAAGVVIAALAAAAGYQTVQRGRAETALAQEKAGRAQDREAAASAAAGAESRYRAEEQRRTAALQETVDAAAQETARWRTAAAAADRAAGGLRNAATAAAARCRGAASNPSTAASRASTPDAGDLFADVLGAMEARGRELAAIADERGAAGRACERFGDALTATQP
jgi:hypothetical protein